MSRDATIPGKPPEFRIGARIRVIDNPALPDEWRGREGTIEVRATSTNVITKEQSYFYCADVVLADGTKERTRLLKPAAFEPNPKRKARAG